MAKYISAMATTTIPILPTSTTAIQNPKAMPQRATNKSISNVHSPVLQCFASHKPNIDDAKVVRRSANYRPGIWDYNYLQSLTSDYKGETYTRQAETLKENVRIIIDNLEHPLDQLELVDNLQRLGLAYHFETEINNILLNAYNNSDVEWKQNNLYATSLEFRLLRQHNYDVSQEVFSSFMNETGSSSFRPYLYNDIKAMLECYEASHYGFEGESIVEEAWKFTTDHLKKLDNSVDLNLATQVRDALGLPLRWRPPRLEARWFIDEYERREDANPILLELAKLDFNIVQGLYKEELKDLSRWWNRHGPGDKLNFARYRLVESFLWAVAIAPEPQYAYCRNINAKAITLITVIDDIYDVYGTLDELKLFTDAVDRWDIRAMEQLPGYMKICFLILHNFANEMAYDILKEQDLNVSLNLKNSWAGSWQAHMLEAEWYYSGYKPTLQEYMKNGWKTVGTPILAIHSYLSGTNPIQDKELNYIESYPDVLYWLGNIFRLQDDLGTSSDELKRGDVPKAIQCYMNETGSSEEVIARENIKDMMRKMWKKVNMCSSADSHLSQTTIQWMSNLVRMGHWIYQYGDGFGAPDSRTKDLALILLFEPIPM